MGIYSHLQLAISDRGCEFIEHWEGLELEAYQDEKGIWTIGIGHIKTAHEGMTITRDEAYELFRQDVNNYTAAINRYVHVALSQRQYDTLVSLCFNIGIEGFRTSTVCKRLNKKKYMEAADAFLMWNKVRDQGRLRTSKGLTNRREAERQMFIEGIWNE